MWRCWVCTRCKIVSFHHVVYCPTCGQKFDLVKDTSENLQRRFGHKRHSDPQYRGDYTPYEWDPRYTQEEQPWTQRKTET